MRILVVGGGIAGPALAPLLASSGKFSVTLIEQAPEFKNIGYAIALWGNGRKILSRLGLGVEIEKESYEIPWMTVEDRDGHPTKSFFFKIFERYGSTLIIPRSVLHKALVSRMEKENVDVRLATRVHRYALKRNGVDVEFENGITEYYDLVVAADGMRSKTREMLFAPGLCHPYGWAVWSFWINGSHPRGAVEMSGSGRMYAIYPLADRAVGVFIAAVAPGTPDPVENRIKHLHEVFADFKPSVHQMIDSIDDPESVFYDHLSYVRMGAWRKDRVILIGDAQHGVSPITGMGASMALEDAYVLADELVKIDHENKIDTALNSFIARREKRLYRFRKIARRIESWMMASGAFAKVRDVVLPLLPTRYFIGSLEKLLVREP